VTGNLLIGGVADFAYASVVLTKQTRDRRHQPFLGDVTQCPCTGRGALQPPRSRQAQRGAEFVLTSVGPLGRLPAETARNSTSFTIFEGTSEIQRMIIGRAVTGLDVR
jgi:hypothetical protein